MDVQDVIVVGGGLSGLSAAYELHKKYGGKLKITVLEARGTNRGRRDLMKGSMILKMSFQSIPYCFY